MTTKNPIPAFATHPGTILVDEMEANGYSQIDLAKLIDIKRSQLNEIIKGKRNINADLALLLEKALGIDADFWMEAQKNYDLDKARIESKNKEQLEAIEIWNVAKELIPISFYRKEKVISGNPLRDIQKIREIYRVENLDQLAAMSVQNHYHRFKKSTKLKSDVVNIMGWVKLVQYNAAGLSVPPFNHENQEQLIADLRAILLKNTDTLNKVQKKLHENGIKLVYQVKGEKTPVDGVSFWSNGNPAIGMTLRHHRLDNFAFTLFHELGHIYKHLVNNEIAEFIDLEIKNEEEEYKNSTEEKQANHFALDKLIKDEDWNKFKRNLAYNNNDQSIIAFANQVKIHPSIVRGRVCFALDNFRSYTSICSEIN
ncbi:HigA family addiction module antitoxin [Flavobacterium cellulosilyticum]|uniref:Addiction module antidote protein, HigA family n=1 Tax=Flavobacterium cellulosilyticum TaxID=2541731 RepID=A0A4R5CD61_9FLAO|nr:HigA family addiction module antitoxin [Flavobacterium cellulosilyticum]TDD95082.1 addiction module antidote protein, HigA family [Flavobacterium cellulosilyticum]